MSGWRRGVAVVCVLGLIVSPEWDYAAWALAGGVYLGGRWAERSGSRSVAKSDARRKG